MNREWTAEDLLPFCITKLQRELVHAFDAAGNVNAAARSLGRDGGTCWKQMKAIKKRAALAGVAPEQGFIPTSCPEGFGLTKSTVHVTAAGTVQRWDRVQADKESAEKAALEAIMGAAAGIDPLPLVKCPRNTKKDLLTLYTITDLHLGMKAWAQEGGADWDMSIARSALWASFSSMIERSENSEMAILCNLGDFLHWDGLLAITPAHHNVLDADTRYDKLAGMALDLMCWCVESLLLHHKKVLVISAEGNHDEAGSVWLRQSLRKIFERTKRVEIDCNPLPYYGYLHGKVLLGFHHGHKKKEKQLRDVFCSDPKFREMWGKAKQTYIHTGHLHNQAKFEDGGAIVERHPTLSARDAYSARGGWQSWRCAHAVTYHKSKGEVGRVTVMAEG